MSDNKGFTLAEIIAVLMIIGILTAIVLPSYVTYIEQGAAKAAQNNLITIDNAQKSYYFANNGVYCTATTGAVANCGNNLSNLNSNLATLNLPNPTSTSLNIADSNFGYRCVNNVSGFSCTATNNSDNNFILTLTNTPIVLPGASGCATSTGASCNPICANGANAYCP